MYRQKDLEIIKLNLNEIEDKASEYFLKNFHEPTLKELNSVYDLIKQFIKKKKRIIYGGYAQNELIKKKNNGKGFYKLIDIPDIEFYSPEPLSDMIEICDILHSKKYMDVQGKQGVHDGTYKIFSNFHNYSDIGYMPKNIFNNMEVIVLDGMRMTHPYFMQIDAFRVYSDILLNNYRLSKTFYRFTSLANSYPFNDDYSYNIINYKINNKIEKIKEFIRRKIIHNSNLIVTGHYAFNYYIKKTEHSKYEIKNYPYYQIITSDYDNDIKKIYKLLNNKFKNITVKEYYPFMDFFSRHMEFIHNNTVILKLYGNNKRCVTYNKSEKKLTNFATSQMLMCYLLIDHSYALINKKYDEANNYLAMIVKFNKARDKYLENKNLTVLDDSPFKEFTYQCIGKPVDVMRESLVQGLEKIKQKKKPKFIYIPKGTKGKVPEYNFENISGNEIKNSKYVSKYK